MSETEFLVLHLAPRADTVRHRREVDGLNPETREHDSKGDGQDLRALGPAPLPIGLTEGSQQQVPCIGADNQNVTRVPYLHSFAELGHLVPNHLRK